jgi:predicted porin
MHQAAWEEVWDTGIATNANFQKGVGSTTNLSWKSPKVGGTTFQIAYAPDNDGSSNVKKASSGSTSDAFGAGWDVVLDAGTADGAINLVVGGSRTELAKVKTGRDLSGDHEEAIVGLQFKFGPVALGGQVSGERTRARALNTAEYYCNSSWGLSFNVNDALSVSYSEARHLQTNTHKSSGALCV